MSVQIPVAKVVEKSDFADAKFYEIEGFAGFFRRLKKPAEGSTVALYDEKTLTTNHFTPAVGPVIDP